MGRHYWEYASSGATRYHVYAWRRDDAKTWDVFTERRGGIARQLATIVGTRRHALDVCRAFGNAPHVPACMDLRT